MGPDVAGTRARAGDHRRRRLRDPVSARTCWAGALVLARLRSASRQSLPRRARDNGALAPWPGRRPPPVDDPRLLARDPRLPLLHAHGSADGSDGARATGRFGVAVALLAALLVAASSDGVLGEGRSPRRADARLCSPTAGGRGHVVDPPSRLRARCAPDRGRRRLRGTLVAGRPSRPLAPDPDRREAGDAAHQDSADRRPPSKGVDSELDRRRRCRSQWIIQRSSPRDALRR